uniref:F-box domain-containing protein n=1 Tax=Graphocephala atropunctata TaxID=36148 RepID=A0A1B6LVC5_9HEMI
MESQLSLEVLPQEVITHIASYLGVQDILACCTTSTSMRHAFNDNFIWKKLCNLKLVDHLSKHRSLDDPYFNDSEKVSSSQTLLCHWRKLYIMQANLLRNLRQGRYEKEQIAVGPSNDVYQGTRVEFCESGEYLLYHSLSVVRDKMVDQIWDIKTVPSLHSSLNFNFNPYMDLDVMDGYDIDTYQMIGNRLVVSQCNVVQIYNLSLISSSDIKLEQTFVLDKSEEISKSLVSCKDNSFAQDQYFEVGVGVESTVCFSFFIGIILNFEEFPNPILHIWNILNGKKVKEESLPAQNIKIVDVKLITCKLGKDLVVQLRVNGHRYMYHYYGYNLLKLEFSSFSVKLNYCDFLIFANDRVVGVGPRKLYLYDYKTSNKVAIKKCDHEILKNTLVVLKNNLLYGTFDSTIFVVKLGSFDVVNTIKLGFTLYSLQVMSERFIVINSSNSEVWEIGETAEKLFKFPVDGSFVGSNQYCTKVVLEKGNNLYFLRFW